MGVIASPPHSYIDYVFFTVSLGGRRVTSKRPNFIIMSMHRYKPLFQFLVAPIIGLLMAISFSLVALFIVDSSDQRDGAAKGMMAFIAVVIPPHFLYLVVSNLIIWMFLRLGKIDKTYGLHLLSFSIIGLPFFIWMASSMVNEGVTIFHAVLGAGIFVLIMFSMYIPNLYLGRSR